MRELLLPVDQDGGEWAPLDFATATAAAGDGRVTAAFHPRLETLPVVDAMGGGAIVLAEPPESRGATAQAVAAALRARLAQRPADLPDRFQFEADLITSVYTAGEVARVFDATVVSKDDRYQDWRLVFETALFEGGRPVFLVPPDWHRASGETIAVAWNRSTETARLIGQSLDIMRAAKAVHVIEVEDWAVPGPDGEQLVAHLARQGIAAQRCTVADNAGPGAAILTAAYEVRADLLLKGAYTQSRLRQMIFGGATSAVIADATIPVLFAH
ncbi:MAG: universal stress protein [Pseudomonadota bacterium]|nr:universal stress protein [Pseudomonadota bacterium]